MCNQAIAISFCKSSNVPRFVFDYLLCPHNHHDFSHKKLGRPVMKWKIYQRLLEYIGATRNISAINQNISAVTRNISAIIKEYIGATSEYISDYQKYIGVTGIYQRLLEYIGATSGIYQRLSKIYRRNSEYISDY